VQGRVRVNGKILNTLGSKISLKDVVELDGKKIIPTKMEYIILNKPKGFHCVHSKSNVKTIFSLISSLEDVSRFTSLDFLRDNYTGLIVISNDTKFINQMHNKLQSLLQIFHLKLNIDFLKKDLKIIKDFDSKYNLKIKSINFVDGANKNEIGLETSACSIKDIEKIFLKFDYKIISCDRVLFSNLTKKDLSRGQWRRMKKQELINLKSF
jgi:23S rRNA pseudouridine2605 synthase